MSTHLLDYWVRSKKTDQKATPSIWGSPSGEDQKLNEALRLQITQYIAGISACLSIFAVMLWNKTIGYCITKGQKWWAGRSANGEEAVNPAPPAADSAEPSPTASSGLTDEPVLPAACAASFSSPSYPLGFHSAPVLTPQQQQQQQQQQLWQSMTGWAAASSQRQYGGTTPPVSAEEAAQMMAKLRGQPPAQ